MKKLFQNSAFYFGFWSSVVLFLVFNLLSYAKSYAEYTNRKIKFSAGDYGGGFPFTAYYVFIGYPNSSGIIWANLIANLLVALVSSLLVGLIFKTVWSKMMGDD